MLLCNAMSERVYLKNQPRLRVCLQRTLGYCARKSHEQTDREMKRALPIFIRRDSRPASEENAGKPKASLRDKAIYHGLVLAGLAIFAPILYLTAVYARHHAPGFAFQATRGLLAFLSLFCFLFAEIIYKRLGRSVDRQETETFWPPVKGFPSGMAPYRQRSETRDFFWIAGLCLGFIALLFLSLPIAHHAHLLKTHDRQAVMAGLCCLPFSVLSFCALRRCPNWEFCLDDKGLLVASGMRQRFFPWHTVDRIEVVTRYGVLGECSGAWCTIFAADGGKFKVNNRQWARVLPTFRERLVSSLQAPAGEAPQPSGLKS